MAQIIIMKDPRTIKCPLCPKNSNKWWRRKESSSTLERIKSKVWWSLRMTKTVTRDIV